MKKLTLTSSSAALIFMLCSQTATAQVDTTPPPATNADIKPDEVIVTGSRIRRSNINTAIPVQTFGAADIETFASTELGEILTEIPGVSFGLSPSGTSGSFQNSGLSAISLRNLGTARSLTLINGRRGVSNSGNGERISLNTIPSGFVRRTEVTTGGASAIYGADAIAGVTNIIMRKNLEGIRANYRFSKAEASGELQHLVDISAGKNFDDDRGNIMVGFSYDNETEVLADETRPETILPIRFVGGEEQFRDNGNLSSNLPGGLFEGDDAWNVGGVWFNDRSLLPEGRTQQQAFETALDGFNFQEGRGISPFREVINGAVVGHYDLSDNLSAFGEIYVSQVNSKTTSSAVNLSSGSDIGLPGNTMDIGQIAGDHPFIPPEVEETRFGNVSWRRRFVEVGRANRTNQRDTVRSVIGLEGSFDNSWEWETHASYGTFRQQQLSENEINKQNVQFALNIEETSPGSGQFQCIDAGARADGCIPLNIFGEGSITTTMADYIRSNGFIDTKRQQYIIAASANGDVFKFPAGPVKLAIGGEYRKEAQQTIGDENNFTGFTTTPFVPDIDESFDVIEGFGEVDIPVLDNASLQLASRVGHYSTIGTILSYNAGGSWKPIPDLRFRGQYSRSQRAPNITEFFSPKRGDFDALNDPCQGLQRDGTGIDQRFSANCLADPTIQAFFADPNNAGNPFDDFQNGIFSPNSGNNQLKEETGTTYTFGTILTPQALPNFSFIADYYNISIKDAIGTVSSQNVADFCYSADNFPNNRFCDVITRDTSTGAVIELVNQSENLNSTSTEGYDLTFNYNRGTNKYGDFDLRVIYSHLLKYETEFPGLDGTEVSDFNGVIGIPKDRVRTRLRWTNDNFQVSYTWNLVGSAVDDITLERTDDRYFKIDPESFHDVYVRYQFPKWNNSQLYGGVRNLADNAGPILPSGLRAGNSRNLRSSTHNRVIGREFYVGVRARF